MATYKVKYKFSGKFKSVKHLEFYLIGGVLLLLAFLIIIPLIGQDTNEFDWRVENEIEHLYSQITAEKYGEVYLQSGRKLIASIDQREFESRLRSVHPQIIGKFSKSCTTIYTDMAERLKRNLFMTFRLETVCRVDSESAESYQYFDWLVSGNEIKLIWFGVEPRKD
jgi:hypothetical protein